MIRIEVEVFCLVWFGFAGIFASCLFVFGFVWFGFVLFGLVCLLVSLFVCWLAFVAFQAPFETLHVWRATLLKHFLTSERPEGYTVSHAV